MRPAASTGGIAATGSAIARRVLQRAATDGSERVWDGVMPTGPLVWQPTPARRVEVPFDDAAAFANANTLAELQQLDRAPTSP